MMHRFCILAALVTSCPPAVAREPNKCGTLDELKSEIEAAFSGGDPERVLDLAYSKETPKKMLEIARNMFTSPAVRKMRPRLIRVVSVEHYPAQPDIAGEFEGRPLTLVFPPTHWIIVHLVTTTKGKPDNDDSNLPSTKFTFPAAKRDDVWWIPWSKFEPGDTAEVAPAIEVPVGVELSKNPQMSLKSVPLAPGVPLIPRCQVELSNDQRDFTEVTIKNLSAMDLFGAVDPDDHWYRGGRFLPAGYFTCGVRGLPRPADEVFSMCRKEFERAFRVQITVGEQAWDGFELVPPKQLPADIRPAKDDEKHRVWPGGKGDIVSRHTFPEFAKWLEGKIAVPLEIVAAPPGEFTFDVPMMLDDKATNAFDWLYDCGFTVRPKKFIKPTVLIEPAGRGT